MLSIKELIYQCVNDKKGSWEQFVALYAGFIKNVLYKHFETIHEIDDILQEACFRLLKDNFKYLRTFHGESEVSFLAYLKTITITTAKNYFKANNKENSCQKITDFEIPDADYSPEIIANKHYDKNKIREIVYCLPIIYRDVIVLHLEGYKQQEIAKILGIDIKTVSTRFTRGKMRLKEKLKVFL